MATHHSRHSSTQPKRPQTHSRSKLAPAFKRASSYTSKKVYQEEDTDDDDEVMATSFLNFCTTCEKQIVIPSNTVLYCSESCRRKDTEKQLSPPLDYSPPPTPFNTTFDVHYRDIVAPRSPTQLHSKRNSLALSDMSTDDHPSDLETSQHESEASRYLRQYQETSSYSSETTNSTVRPSRYTRPSISSQATHAPPSLSHTPASSVSYSLPYTPSTRPLPPRNVSSYGARSIELVTPWAYSTTAPLTPPKYSMKAKPTIERSSSTIEGEIMYEKSPIPEASMANGSLGRLLATSH